MANLNIALIQSIQHWHDPAQNQSHFGARIAECRDVDLVILPEMFSTGFTMASKQMAETMDGPTMGWLQAQANNHNVNICGSLIIEASGQYFNRFVLVSPEGNIRHYDKRHLFRMADEHNHFAPGEARQIFQVGHRRQG